MRRLWETFQNIKFRNKMAVSYISMALIPLILFAAISGGIFIAQARKTTIAHTAQITGQVSDAIDVYISSIDKMANYLARTMDRTGMLQENEPLAVWQNGKKLVQYTLKDIAASHPEIAGILIAMSDDKFVATGMSRISRDKFTGESWYQSAEAQPDKIVLVSSAVGRNIVTNGDYSIDDVFSLAKAVTDMETGQVRGVILLDIRHDLIKESINSVTIGQQGFVFILDSEDNIVYTPANDIVYRVPPALLSGENLVTAQINGGRYQISYHQSSYTNWKTVGVFSLDEVMRGVNSIYYILVFCITVAVVLVAMVSIRLASSVTKPISKLQGLMRQAESGDLSVRFNSLYQDEIGDLGHSFNHMIARIDNLIRRVYQEQQSKRNAELKILQEQIKPHFLYNTLDTIGWMARDYQANDIVLLVDALTSMFRIGLSHGKEYITVREEISHVSNYLYIQKIRYKDKLTYEIRIEESFYQYQLPKLILQPLVENAIYHGIKQKRGGGTIRITGSFGNQESPMLKLTVEDNGAGIGEEKLAQLKNRLENPQMLEDKQSFGLFYVAQRIQLCYGENQSIALDSTEGKGTTVIVMLPLKRGL